MAAKSLSPARRARRVVLSIAVGAVVALPACGDGGDPPATATGEAGAELAEAVHASTQTSFRFEARMTSITDGEAAGDPSGADPAVTGMVAAGWVHNSIDLAAGAPPIEEALGADPGDAGLPPGDLTAETITDGSVAYIHMPFLAAPPPGDRGDSTDGSIGTDADLAAAAAVVAAVSDGWGRVDLTGLTPAEVPRMLGAETLDPLLFLRMVEGGRDVESTGTTEIDGADVRGLRALVTYERMIAAQGLDVAEVRGRFEDLLARAGTAGDQEVAAAVDGILATEIPVEVWIDDHGRVRRSALDLDMHDLLDAASAVVDEPMPDLGGVSMSIDLFDHGDPSIVVGPPASSTDVTDAFLHLVER